jgi:phosphatidylserine/phosphatidylglycerophosphate/cardiolipin synthase-like enzyme
MFTNEKAKKALIGSANLTSPGLESKGELMVEIEDSDTLENVSSYVNLFFNKSVAWEDYIDEYAKLYEEHKPIIKELPCFSKLKSETKHKKPGIKLIKPKSITDSSTYIEDDDPDAAPTVHSSIVPCEKLYLQKK